MSRKPDFTLLGRERKRLQVRSSGLDTPDARTHRTLFDARSACGFGHIVTCPGFLRVEIGRQFFQRWKLLQQLAERQACAKSFLHGLTGLGEEQRIKSQFKKFRRGIRVREVHAG